jgi:hypothetical protein
MTAIIIEPLSLRTLPPVFPIQIQVFPFREPVPPSLFNPFSKYPISDDEDCSGSVPSLIPLSHDPVTALIELETLTRQLHV